MQYAVCFWKWAVRSFVKRELLKFIFFLLPPPLRFLNHAFMERNLWNHTGTIVNWAFPSQYEGSFKITATSLLTISILEILAFPYWKYYLFHFGNITLSQLEILPFPYWKYYTLSILEIYPFPYWKYYPFHVENITLSILEILPFPYWKYYPFHVGNITLSIVEI